MIGAILKIAAEVAKRSGPALSKAGKGLKEGAKKAYDWAKKKLGKEAPKKPCKECSRRADTIKSDEKLRKQMEQRGWSEEQIEEAISQGEIFLQ